MGSRTLNPKHEGEFSKEDSPWDLRFVTGLDCRNSHEHYLVPVPMHAVDKGKTNLSCRRTQEETPCRVFSKVLQPSVLR